MWGNIAQAANGIVQSGVQVYGMATPAIRENQLAIAEANAAAAVANAEAVKNAPGKQWFGIDQKYIIIAAVVLALLIGGILIMKK